MTAEPGKTYQYDAENRLLSINSGAVATYVYNAEGQRVRKISGGTTTEYIYGAGGVVAEKVGTTWTVGYVYLNGQLLAQYKNGTTRFAHKDHLGSTRLLTKPDGTYDSADVYDYLPFGESVGSSAATTTHKFTGKERDAESGLDYFGARHYASNLGRFLSPDLILHPDQSSYGPVSFMVEPQNWNKYQYGQNNPLKFFDPDGAEAGLFYERLPNGQMTVHSPLSQRAKEASDSSGAKVGFALFTVVAVAAVFAPEAAVLLSERAAWLLGGGATIAQARDRALQAIDSLRRVAASGFDVTKARLNSPFNLRFKERPNVRAARNWVVRWNVEALQP
jgi:RHS repeat-associated protein